MADRSKIEWTDASWNPIRARDRATGKIGWHCEHLSPGCAKCYSEGFNARLGTQLPFKPGHRADVEIVLDPTMLLQPLRWRRPRMIFVCSMTDLFADFVPDAFIDQVFAVMALCPQHTFQVLTKRSARMRAYIEAKRRQAPEWVALPEAHARVLLPYEGGWPTNVWLGVSAEDQRRADERVPDLLKTPAAVRFVSAEPLLGRVDLRMIAADDTGETDALRGLTFCQGRNEPAEHARLDWVIVGGESGREARPMHPDWARGLRDQCAAAGVPFFFKQWGEWATGFSSMSTGEPVFRQFSSVQQWVDKASTWVRGGICLDAQGRDLRIGADFHRARDEQAFPVTVMHRVGKKVAGRLLDGIEHNGVPGRAPALAGAA